VSENLRLSDIDRERFTDAVEASFAVSIRPQFFTWTQTSVQGILGHEILVCGVADGAGHGLSMHRFSATRYFRQEHFDALCDTGSGLLPRLVAAAEGGRRSVLCTPGQNRRAADESLSELVRDQELVNLVAQFVLGTRGKIEAFYAFARLDRTPDSRSAYMAELIVPHLHAAFIRVLAHERDLVTSESRRAGRMVTRRQEQILALVKAGKTNFEIAQELDCSPWTVKNHIQAILRKLDSHSRTHAIARAISLGILPSD
jgi:transcriptional regulator EpsA